MTDRDDSGRLHAAWLLYCFSEGYVKAEDRAILSNWLLDDPATLHFDDAALRPHLLAMTDELLAAIAEGDDTGSTPEPTPETFVLERVENPHPDMLADALLIRANARAAVERLGELADYDVDWRIAWKFTVRGMAKATGCTTEELEAWMDRMEAKA